MEAEDRSGPGDLTHYERLVRSPQTFHIFLALRAIEAAFPKAPPLGASRRPREDRVRLGQEPAVGFERTTITAFDPPQGARPGQLTNLAFGFFGPHGPLPAHLTEYARERLINARDPTMVAFVDMLTHRMMSLFYRAWTTGQPAADYDRDNGRFDQKVAALAGLVGPTFNGRDAMPDVAKRHFAGFLAPGPRNPAALEAMLSAFFRSAVTVTEFVGSWLDLEPDDRWQLGAATGLGQGTVIGSRVWSRSAKFSVRIGPMSLSDYERLLPGSPALGRLVAIVRNFAGDQLDFDINLVLRADEVPAARLGGETRLGQTSWIGKRPGTLDADDLTITPTIETSVHGGRNAS